MHGLGVAETEARVKDLVERIDLGDALDEYAVNYSKPANCSQSSSPS